MATATSLPSVAALLPAQRAPPPRGEGRLRVTFGRRRSFLSVSAAAGASPDAGEPAWDALGGVSVLAANTGDSVLLRDLWDPTEGVAVVALMRHFGCFCCWELASVLRDSMAKFDSAGAKLIAIGVGTPDKARILADRAYNVLGLYHGLGRTLFSPASATNPFGKGSLGVVSLVEGMVDEDQLRGELNELVDKNWVWDLRRTSVDTFVTHFPSHQILEAFSRATSIKLFNHDCHIRVSSYGHDPEEDHRLHCVWLQVYGIPGEMKQEDIVREITKLAAKPLVVDELSLIKPDPVRVKVLCRDSFSLAGTIMFFFQDLGFPVTFMVEKKFKSTGGPDMGFRQGPRPRDGFGDKDRDKRDDRSDQNDQEKDDSENDDLLFSQEGDQEGDSGKKQQAVDSVDFHGVLVNTHISPIAAVDDQGGDIAVDHLISKFNLQEGPGVSCSLSEETKQVSGEEEGSLKEVLCYSTEEDEEEGEGVTQESLQPLGEVVVEEKQQDLSESEGWQVSGKKDKINFFLPVVATIASSRVQRDGVPVLTKAMQRAQAKNLQGPAMGACAETGRAGRLEDCNREDDGLVEEV